MKIDIRAKNLELTQKIKSYMERKTAGLWKYVNRAGQGVKSWVEIEKEKRHRRGDVYRSELQFTLPKKSIRAEAKGETWRTAFDRAKNKARSELRKYKEIKLVF